MLPTLKNLKGQIDLGVFLRPVITSVRPSVSTNIHLLATLNFQQCSFPKFSKGYVH